MQGLNNFKCCLYSNLSAVITLSAGVCKHGGQPFTIDDNNPPDVIGMSLTRNTEDKKDVLTYTNDDPG